MAIVKKAVVLAAGFGTRLKPFTCTTPKPLLPVWGVPMLERIIEMLRDRGVDDVVVNCHYLPEQIEEWVESYRRRISGEGCEMKIGISREPEILGSGGALNPLREWIGNERFYLVNSDIVMENAPKLELREDESEIGVCVVSAEGPRTLEVENVSGFITNWRSEDALYDGTWTYCGMALLKPQILSYVKGEGFSSIVSAYEAAMSDGKFVRAVASEDLLWEDAGTLSKYIDLNRDGDDNAFADIPQIRSLLPDGESSDVRFLSIRGSNRVFFKTGDGVAVVYDDESRAENGIYCQCARFLASKGLRVPAILKDRPEFKALLMEDAGCEKKMSLEEYAEVVKELVKFNALGADGDLPGISEPFGPELWKWEHELFAKHCLETRFGMQMTDEVSEELERASGILESEPKALVHRDFQSSNILWGAKGFSIIDFQGMRIGPAVYDLASLLYDPYVEMPARRREALSALYAKESGRPEILEALPFAAVQRLVQCLGAYGRLVSAGYAKFGAHVGAALSNLLLAADDAGLDAVGALAEELIAEEEKKHH